MSKVVMGPKVQLLVDGAPVRQVLRLQWTRTRSEEDYYGMGGVGRDQVDAEVACGPKGAERMTRWGMAALLDPEEVTIDVVYNNDQHRLHARAVLSRFESGGDRFSAWSHFRLTFQVTSPTVIQPWTPLILVVRIPEEEAVMAQSQKASPPRVYEFVVVDATKDGDPEILKVDGQEVTRVILAADVADPSGAVRQRAGYILGKAGVDVDPTKLDIIVRPFSPFS